MSPILVWFRRDLRLSDHVALTEACAQDRPVIPIFICDETVEAMGAAPKWRLGLSVDALSRDLSGVGSRLILRRGRALDVLRQVIGETGAGAVYWTRLYDGEAVARDKSVKAALKADRIAARSFPGHVLFEPMTVAPKQGGFYKVFSPYWKQVQTREVAPLLARPKLPVPTAWPWSDQVADWRLGAAMGRGADVVADFLTVGEAAAQDRLDAFVESRLARYGAHRDVPAADVTSRLSENLAWGEISAARVWHGVQRGGDAGSEAFLRQLAWRDFAHNLAFHTPQITSRNWRSEWEAFPWRSDDDLDVVQAWRQARTGVPFVDAALREMYVTGHMHNRARMIVASYLTKHLMVHWKSGLKWFAECLIDWDPASNAMGWQWSAGSGPDAAPYFRVFNPESQRQKFDPNRAYVDRWIAEGRARPTDTALRYFQAIPRRWSLSPTDVYPAPIVSMQAGREAALSAYADFRK